MITLVLNVCGLPPSKVPLQRSSCTLRQWCIFLFLIVLIVIHQSCDSFTVVCMCTRMYILKRAFCSLVSLSIGAFALSQSSYARLYLLQVRADRMSCPLSAVSLKPILCMASKVLHGGNRGRIRREYVKRKNVDVERCLMLLGVTVLSRTLNFNSSVVCFYTCRCL